jgi:hypothetical protein
MVSSGKRIRQAEALGGQQDKTVYATEVIL